MFSYRGNSLEIEKKRQCAPFLRRQLITSEQLEFSYVNWKGRKILLANIKDCSIFLFTGFNTLTVIWKTEKKKRE